MYRKMKIALISAGLEPRQLRLQPYRSLLEIARQINLLGHEVVLISDGVAHLPAKDKVFELPLHRLDSLRIFRGGHNPKLLATLAQVSPDIVFWHLGLSSFLHQQLHSPFDQPTIGILTSPIHLPFDVLRLGPKKLFSNLDLAAHHLAGSMMPNFLIRQAFKSGGLHGMITLSEKTRQYLIQKGAPAGRIWVAPPGVDPAWLNGSIDEAARQNVRYRLGFEDDDFVVIYFGSPAPVRGLHTTLLAMRMAARSHPQLRLLILSRRRVDEWERPAAHLNNLIAQNGLKERVRVVDGFLKQQDLIEYIKSSDVVCLPFELVPSDVPLSILEAMALGQGVVTTTVASIPELVENGRGFLVPPASASALARQLQAIAENPNLARDRGQQAKAFVEASRTWTDMGKSLQEVLVTAYGR